MRIRGRGRNFEDFISQIGLACEALSLYVEWSSHDSLTVARYDKFFKDAAGSEDAACILQCTPFLPVVDSDGSMEITDR